MLGEHSEIHALYSIITGKKSGFAMHPETKRWIGHLDLLVRRHELLIKEMTLRNFNHNSPLQCSKCVEENNKSTWISYLDLPSIQFEMLHERYSAKGQKGRMPLPRNGTEFWAHHKYSVMARGYQYYKDVQKFMENRLSIPIRFENELIFKVYSYLKMDVPVTGLNSVIFHLWGYFKKKASEEEKDRFFNLESYMEKVEIIFSMAKKYRQNYLLHSTFFADFLSN